MSCLWPMTDELLVVEMTSRFRAEDSSSMVTPESTSFKRGIDASYPAIGHNKWKKNPRRQGLSQVLEQYFLKNKNETKYWEQGLESKFSDPQSSWLIQIHSSVVLPLMGSSHLW